MLNMSKRLLKQKEAEKRHNMIYNIPNNIEDQFTNDCLKIARFKSCQILDCSQSICRQKIKEEPEQVLEIIRNKSLKHFSFILRRSIFSQLSESKKEVNYWEYCASGFEDSVEHFVWLEIKEEEGYKLVDKYKLLKNDEL